MQGKLNWPQPILLFNLYRALTFISIKMILFAICNLKAVVSIGVIILYSLAFCFCSYSIAFCDEEHK